MAFLDALVQLAGNQAITATAAGSNVFDVTGVGSGTVPPMITGVNGSTGAAVVIGFDIGAGDGFAIPQVLWTVPSAFSGPGTLTISLQAAPDSGAGSAGTYQDIVATGAMSVAQLVANTQGQFQVPPVGANWVGEPLPRFYRLNFTVAGGSFGLGNINAYLVLNPSQATKIQKYPGNFVA